MQTHLQQGGRDSPKMERLDQAKENGVRAGVVLLSDKVGFRGKREKQKNTFYRQRPRPSRDGWSPSASDASLRPEPRETRGDRATSIRGSGAQCPAWERTRANEINKEKEDAICGSICTPIIENKSYFLCTEDIYENPSIHHIWGSIKIQEITQSSNNTKSLWLLCENGFKWGNANQYQRHWKNND